jgi:hypothetical protein
MRPARLALGLVVPWILACAVWGRRPLPGVFDEIARRECRSAPCGGPGMDLRVWNDGSGVAVLLGVTGDDRRCPSPTLTLYDRAGAAVWTGSASSPDAPTHGLSMSRAVPCGMLDY